MCYSLICRCTVRNAKDNKASHNVLYCAKNVLFRRWNTFILCWAKDGCLSSVLDFACAVIVSGSGSVLSCPWTVIELSRIVLSSDLITLPLPEGHRTVIGTCCCHHWSLFMVLRCCRTVPWQWRHFLCCHCWFLPCLLLKCSLLDAPWWNFSKPDSN